MNTEAQNLEQEVKQLKRDWKSMILISHDFFHSWRKTVEERLGKEEADGMVNRFWELVGVGTGQAYLDRGRDPQDIRNVVRSMVRASEVMGESARMETDGEEFLLVHDACPWVDSFAATGAAGKCQPGCDKWFATTLKTITREYEVRTESCLAAGEATCTRRFVKA